ncbi:hypothetical protein LEM8419_03331 [Neolewinella maritima]|uniref:TonB-dependent receptor plug domain-containing protein n=2 Tax=Neolewinella maritima TaxID=1383882 RepID=A0ABM9B4Z7_9BACT|nr:hypothetical protein LEM8419_03331 [Neolewinella maritima]
MIRGDNGTKGNGNSPLFVVDGRPSGHDYAAIYNSISMSDVKSVKVLKGPSQTNVYGSDATGGVIAITLRRD